MSNNEASVVNGFIDEVNQENSGDATSNSANYPSSKRIQEYAFTSLI